MSKILLGVIAVLISICGFLYWQNSSLQSLNIFFCAGCSDLVEEALACSRQRPPHQLSISLFNH